MAAAAEGDENVASTSVKADETIIDDDVKPSPARKKARTSSNPFDVSPQKKDRKKIKLELDASEVKAAPKRWKEQLEALQRQRRRIVAPVDEMGCEENGTDAHRADAWRVEDTESKARRERFTCLVSLMLSSQTKDEVTAAYAHPLDSKCSNCLEYVLTFGNEEVENP